MATTNCKQNSRDYCSGEIIRVANPKETVVAIPVIVPPVEVEVALRAIPVQIRYVPIAVHLRDRTLCSRSSSPPPLELSQTAPSANTFSRLYRICDLFITNPTAPTFSIF